MFNPQSNNFKILIGIAGIIFGGWGIFLSSQQFSVDSQLRDVIDHWNAWRVVMRDPSFLKRSADQADALHRKMMVNGVDPRTPAEFAKSFARMQSVFLDPDTRKEQHQLLELMTSEIEVEKIRQQHNSLLKSPPVLGPLPKPTVFDRWFTSIPSLSDRQAKTVCRAVFVSLFGSILLVFISIASSMRNIAVEFFLVTVGVDAASSAFKNFVIAKYLGQFGILFIVVGLASLLTSILLAMLRLAAAIATEKRINYE